MSEHKKSSLTAATVGEEKKINKTINELRVEAGLTPLDNPTANVLLKPLVQSDEIRR